MRSGRLNSSGAAQSNSEVRERRASGWCFLQFARFRRKVRRKLSEVENTLRVNVQALRRDTEEFHDILVKAERKRELTKEEQMILKKFKKRLEITEKEIEQKLENVT